MKNPDGIHHMLNLTHEPVVGQYLGDVAAVLEEPATLADGGAGGVVAQY